VRTLVVDALRLVGARTAMGRYLEILAFHWSRSESPFDRVVLVAPARAAPLEVTLGSRTPVSLVRYGPSMPLGLWEQLALPYAARGAALLFCPSYVAPLLHAGPVVVANHGIYEAIPGEFSPWRRLRTIPLFRASARRARRVIANSNATRASVAHHFGVPQSGIDVVHPAPAEVFFAEHSDEEVGRAVHAVLGARVPYVLFVGKLSPRRNVPALIEAFARVRRERDLTHRLLIVGPNTSGVPIEGLAESHGVGGFVIHQAHMDHPRLASIYAGADLFVLPTTAEGISWTMFEAMASGTAVLTVDHDALEEGAGDAAMRVPSASVEDLASGLALMLTDPALLERYARAGRERASGFSWREAAARTMRILDGAGLAADRGRCAPDEPGRWVVVEGTGG
jgi:glycosyltransferase involved in cell wall biosynthesis